MAPETINAARSLGDVGVDVLLIVALIVLGKYLQGKDVTIAAQQVTITGLQDRLLEQSKQMLEQSKSDADRLLDERTVIIPLVSGSTEALRRTTDQLAVTTSLIVEQRDLLARHNPNGNR